MNAWLTAAEAALCEVAVKGGVLLALACVAVWALRGGPASARHLVWLAGLACALMLPVCAGLLPGWRALPAWMSWEAMHAAAARAQHGTDGTADASRPTNGGSPRKSRRSSMKSPRSPRRRS